jgi:hypothetical protein
MGQVLGLHGLDGVQAMTVHPVSGLQLVSLDLFAFAQGIQFLLDVVQLLAVAPNTAIALVRGGQLLLDGARLFDQFPTMLIQLARRRTGRGFICCSRNSKGQQDPERGDRNTSAPGSAPQVHDISCFEKLDPAVRPDRCSSIEHLTRSVFRLQGMVHQANSG